MRGFEERFWSDGRRHWFDGMMNGYYADEGMPGIYRDDGSPVPTTDGTVIENRAEFAAAIRTLYASHAEWVS